MRNAAAGMSTAGCTGPGQEDAEYDAAAVLTGSRIRPLCYCTHVCTVDDDVSSKDHRDVAVHCIVQLDKVM